MDLSPLEPVQGPASTSMVRPSTRVTLAKSILSANALGSATGPTRKIVSPPLVLEFTRQLLLTGFMIAMNAWFNRCTISVFPAPLTVMVTVSSGPKPGESGGLEACGIMENRGACPIRGGRPGSGPPETARACFGLASSALVEGGSEAGGSAGTCPESDAAMPASLSATGSAGVFVPVGFLAKPKSGGMAGALGRAAAGAMTFAGWPANRAQSIAGG